MAQGNGIDRATVSPTVAELDEFQALYSIQRARIDRLHAEERAGGMARGLDRAIETGAKLLVAITRTKEIYGLVAQPVQEQQRSLDFSLYSAQTAAVLSNPESRHRVLNIVQRIARHAARPLPTTIDDALPDENESLVLPMPRG